MANVVDIRKFVGTLPDYAIPWVHLATALMYRESQAPKPQRDPAWQQKYDEIVNRIHDERLDKEVAARITDGILTGILSESELDGWIEDAKVAVEKYNKDHSDTYGRARIRDTIQAKLKKFYDRSDLKWTPPNGGEVGKLKEAPKKQQRYTFVDADGKTINDFEEGVV